MLLSMAACAKEEAPKAETLTGVGKGFGGEVTVTVTREGDKITNVVAVGEKETNGIGSKALEELPAKIVAANSTEVDVVAGATYTSNAIIYAVNNALDPVKYPAPTEEAKEDKEPEAQTAAKVFQGFGLASNGRLGPGKDNTETPVYSTNDVFAHTLFDENGKILALYVDILEVATPNYDGEGMPHFSGYPGQGGYNYDENHDEVVDSKTPDTEENFLAEVNSWTTKRERGDGYRLNSGTWTEEMDYFQDLFIGMTVEEVEQWFGKYTSDVNGRPLKADSDKPEDQTKYNALTAEEKTMLADITSAATMSLKDAHGDIVAAIKESYENRIPVESTDIASQGTALVSVPRVGPGKDDKDVQVYSINKVFANSLFDKDGKLVSLNVDILETATPNYDGAEMPHFSGFTGQSYNNDENHDEKIDGTLTVTDEIFQKEVGGWLTKRERGDSYRLNSGTWTEEMDYFEDLFLGMTVEEIKAWNDKYTSDVNGRPLKADSDKPEDQTKYNALTTEEKAMLTDVTASATMSLTDAHGDIIAAIVKSFENKLDLKLTIQ
ncbi:MAG: FMN-binding protein [Sedimentibacter sp.]|uniref:FMN-binding protein n=1 Tax=Sedimentibacter sp. TaxID=1960295 RepID=UPI00315902A9